MKIKTIGVLALIALSGLILTAQQDVTTFEKRLEALNNDLNEGMGKGMDKAFKAFEEGARKLLKEFPDRPEVYEAIAKVAGFTDGEAGVTLAKIVLDSKAATAKDKEQAQATLAKLARLGKPVSFKFTALDGKEIDTEKLKGKVLLIDFWATWCPPCVASVPHLKKVYEKYRGRGLEIVGINLDEDRKILERFLKKEKILWPQRFDGQPWETSQAKANNLVGIPSVWLVDKDGILRYAAVEDGLEAKIEKLL